jgi:hypothetical protein
MLQASNRAPSSPVLISRRSRFVKKTTRLNFQVHPRESRLIIDCHCLGIQTPDVYGSCPYNLSRLVNEFPVSTSTGTFESLFSNMSVGAEQAGLPSYGAKDVTEVCRLWFEAP